jgi:hypothetical protein
MRSGLSIALIRVLLLLASVAVCLEGYTRWPSRAVISPVEIPSGSRHVVLLFHGTNGKDEPMLLAVADKFAKLVSDQPDTFVRHVVWSPWSDNRLRAGVHGRNIARQLGQELAELENLETIRLVAHSAGAYLLDPICSAYKSAAKTPAHVELTFLDGMGIRGGWDFSYGYRHYGECGDFSKGIISMDPVPGTNAPLQQAYTIDVTESVMRSDVPSHLWPVEYFLNTLSLDEVTPGLRTHQEQPRGAVVTD